MAKKSPSEAYLLKASTLTKTEAEYLFSRMGKKLGKRLEDSKLVAIEALALQLEVEDEQLKEWRERFAEIRDAYRKQLEKAKR